MYTIYLYLHREFLAHFAGPLLLDVIEETVAAVKGEDVSGTRPKISLHSGHDVNLLGMLFALNAAVDDLHWPSYGKFFMAAIS